MWITFYSSSTFPIIQMARAKLSVDALTIEPYRGSSLELRLDLNYRNLQKLPEDIFKLAELQWLNLNVNRLRDLPIELQYLRHLKWLYLESNLFETFPAVLCDLKELVRLYFSSNQLRTVAMEINKMANLRLLDLSDNAFKDFPIQICDPCLNNLEKIFIHGNNITSLPSQISNLKGLKSLWLADNNLEWLPQSLSELRSLEDLNISQNSIRTLPAYLGTKLTELKKLNWEECPLITLIADSLGGGVDNLRKLQGDVNSKAEKKRLVEFRTDGKEANEKPCYAMRTRPRGIAVIIDNLCDLEAFQNADETERDRPGSKSEGVLPVSRMSTPGSFSLAESTDALRGVLIKLGMNVRVMRGLMSLDIISALRFVSLEDHSYFDCLVVCILSKGSRGKVYGPDGISVHVDQLTDIFSRQNCPTLADKPKLFFLQILELEGDVKMSNRSPRNNDNLKKLKDASSPNNHSTCKRNPLNDLRLIPNDTDFLLTLALVPQNAICESQESVYKFYVEKLFILLEKYARKLNLLDILTTVHAEVRSKRIKTKNGSDSDVITIDPIIQSSLKYNLYLSVHNSGSDSKGK